ncbi:hypothetical protein [Brachybacterium sp. AOP35-5H-19]|uniref:hypothetical protein n=1 Tax=Brachybacterium sp. AOP35-5H-19 TaxID=3457685 RepID=UPI0040337DAC
MGSSPTRRSLNAVRSTSLLATLGLGAVAISLSLLLALFGFHEVTTTILLASTLIAVIFTGAVQQRRDTIAASRMNALAVSLSRVEKMLTSHFPEHSPSALDIVTGSDERLQRIEDAVHNGLAREHNKLRSQMTREFRRLEDQAGQLRARAIGLRDDISALDPASHIDGVRYELHAVAERLELQANRRQTATQRLLKQITQGLGTKEQLDYVTINLDHVVSQIESSAESADGLASAQDIELLLAQLLSMSRRAEG